jgi:lipopolysaccharide biosynthesis glycosyltransferase
MIRIFVGYDERETVAFHACVSSIIRHASQPVSITPLCLANLAGYDEPVTDGSNAFSYSRFLVPWLCDFAGAALFIDGDMIVKGDVAELWALRQVDKGVQVVQHDYRTKAPVKYLGARNEDYPRKNWSSVVLWNCSHFPNRYLTPEYVKNATGAHLHRFAWLDDDRIGALPAEWNWLVGEYPVNPSAKLLHYTLGTPCFDEYADCDHAEEWHLERQLLNGCEQR